MIALLLAFLMAHGDAAWIGDSGYIGRDGTACCGVKDCERARGVERMLGGWLLPDTGEWFPDDQKPGLYQSIDRDFWWCRPRENYTRCLFVPIGPSA